MHTVMVIGGGGTASAATAALWFIPFWVLASAVNLSIGMRHGYSFAQELSIGLAVFGVPAAIAAAIWWRFGRGA